MAQVIRKAIDDAAEGALQQSIRLGKTVDQATVAIQEAALDTLEELLEDDSVSTIGWKKMLVRIIVKSSLKSQLLLLRLRLLFPVLLLPSAQCPRIAI